MSKLKEIVDGYSSWIFPDKQTEELAIKRLGICKACPEMSNYPDKINTFSSCNKCGCVLQAKSRSINSVCPLSKW